MNKDDTAHVLDTLYDPKTIRLQSHRILDLARKNQLRYFSVHPEKIAETSQLVINVIRDQYPELNIPYHSRWRHFEVGGIDRIQHLASLCPNKSEWGKMLYELVIISVFLDAGAGQDWRYHEPSTQVTYSRSEGLALASLALYTQGTLSNSPDNPLRVDAERLLHFTQADLSRAFQISSDNPLAGIEGRVALLNQLGASLKNKPEYFGADGRLGNFYTYVSSLAVEQQLSAVSLFQAVLQAFNDVWPKRLRLNDVPLGDVWIHSALKTQEFGSDYIPFHKLSQWLTYSLIEPLELAQIKVSDLDELTGLPEYRNGGLLIDSGLIRLKNPEDLQQAHDPSSELIVEWRALTVALLDELAHTIREQLHLDAQKLPLAKILQGGTWEAGRRIAKQKRALGTPPLHIISDGTVF